MITRSWLSLGMTILEALAVMCSNLNVCRALGQAVVEHTFNPNTQEVEPGRSLSLRPAWSIEQDSGSYFTL